MKSHQLLAVIILNGSGVNLISINLLSVFHFIPENLNQIYNGEYTGKYSK